MHSYIVQLSCRTPLPTGKSCCQFLLQLSIICCACQLHLANPNVESLSCLRANKLLKVAFETAETPRHHAQVMETNHHEFDSRSRWTVFHSTRRARQ